MKMTLLTIALVTSSACLTSCDTVALEQAFLDANANNANSGRPTYGPNYYPYRPAYDDTHNDHYNHRDHSPKYDHPYQVGYRIGEDDFHHGYEKKYMLHEKMYDHNTREQFKKGYYAGYEAARERDKHRRR